MIYHMYNTFHLVFYQDSVHSGSSAVFRSLSQGERIELHLEAEISTSTEKCITIRAVVVIITLFA